MNGASRRRATTLPRGDRRGRLRHGPPRRCHGPQQSGGAAGATIGELAEAEPLYRLAVQILIEFRRRTGHEHPNFPTGLDNYRGLLQTLRKTPQEIDEQVVRAGRAPGFRTVLTVTSTPARPGSTGLGPYRISKSIVTQCGW